MMLRKNQIVDLRKSDDTVYSYLGMERFRIPNAKLGNYTFLGC